MIIVIGMDNTGKTTLVDKLSEGMDLMVRRSIGPATESEHTKWIMERITESIIGEDIICERFPIFEEIVYGNTLRKGSHFNLEDSTAQLLKSINPIIIYARPGKEKIFDFGDRPQMPGVIKHQVELLAAYDELAFRLLTHGWSLVTYNYETDNGNVEEFMGALQTAKRFLSGGRL